MTSLIPYLPMADLLARKRIPIPLPAGSLPYVIGGVVAVLIIGAIVKARRGSGAGNDEHQQ